MPSSRSLPSLKPAAPSENSPVPMAMPSTVKVAIAPMASLNADSDITVCATRSRTRTCLKIGTSVAGSVEASVAPSSIATMSGTPRTRCATYPVMSAVTTTPAVRDHDDRDPDLLHYLEAQRGAAVEQDVGRAENQDQLVERRIGADMHQIGGLRAEQHAGDQEHRDVRDAGFLRDQPAQRSGGEDGSEHDQHLLGDLDCAAWLHAPPPVPTVEAGFYSAAR